MKRMKSSSRKLMLKSVSIIALLTLICLTTYVAVVQAQDFVLGHEVLIEDPPGYSGYSKDWWRIRLSETSATFGQDIRIHIDFKVEWHYEGPSPLRATPRELTIIVNTGGLTSEPLTMSFSYAKAIGIDLGQPLPFDFQGSGTVTIDFVIPEDAKERSYQFQAEMFGWNPSNIVTLEAIGEKGGALTVTIVTDKEDYNVGEPSSCTITVKDTDGNPVLGADLEIVLVHEEEGIREEGSATTDGNGRFSWDWTWDEDDKGTWRIDVTASKRGYDGGYSSTMITVGATEDEDRFLAETILDEKIRLWLPPEEKLEGDNITRIHYKVNRHDGKIYISYVVEWNRQRGKWLGHDFDCEPVVVVLDENTNKIEEVLYDKGHYKVGRTGETYGGMVQLTVSSWAHSYEPNYGSTPKGYKDTDILDTTKLSKEGKFGELNEETLGIMNRNLRKVRTSSVEIGGQYYGLYPPLSLDQVVNCPWEIKNHFTKPGIVTIAPLVHDVFVFPGNEEEIWEVPTGTSYNAKDLPKGTVMITGPESQIIVKEGSVDLSKFKTITVGQNTVYVVEDYADKVFEGGVHVKWEGALEDWPPVAHETPYGFITSTETEYEIVVDLEQDQTSVFVYQGSVELSDSDQEKTVVIGEGETSTVGFDVPPSEPTSFDPDTRVKWWEKTGEYPPEYRPPELREEEGNGAYYLPIFIVFIVAILLYVKRDAVSAYLRSIRPTTKQEYAFCEGCGKRIPAGSVYCLHCGDKQRVAGAVFCEKCAKRIPAGSTYCPFCGHKQVP